MIGSPIATTEPKLISSTITAASTPIISEPPSSSSPRTSSTGEPPTDLQPVAARVPGGVHDLFDFVIVQLVGGDVELGGRVGDFAVVADRAGATLFVGAGDFADMGKAFDLGEDRFHLALDRRRLDARVGLVDDLHRVARLCREAVFEQVESVLGVGARQAEIFGEVRPDRAGDHPEADQGDDPADDHRLAVAGGPGGEASHRSGHGSNGSGRRT
jgi:hypothetical protein